MNDPFVSIKKYLSERFSLSEDKDNEEKIIESIKKGIVFKGISVWILMCAIFLASIGLNVNSTAVIVGAMLISPLMGPIMGIGLGAGIFDFELIKSAGKNLLLMVGISITTSTIYFLLSPLDSAQSELLSRTSPTIWDVLIAIFGGLAGIIAGTSKEKGNVIPGVAIATALMPPLCTAGFGLARGDFSFFVGAFYLFCINTVFISVSTFMLVRFLKFKPHNFVNFSTEKKIRRIITTIVLVTIIPSLFIAYMTVKKLVFEKRARSFVENEFEFPHTQKISYTVDYEKKKIEVVLLGEYLADEKIELLKQKLPTYHIENTQLAIKQGYREKSDEMILKTGILEELYVKNRDIIQEKDRTILALKKQLEILSAQQLPLQEISAELKAIDDNVSIFSITSAGFFNQKNNSIDTSFVAYVKHIRKPNEHETNRLLKWVKARIKSDKVKLIIE